MHTSKWVVVAGAVLLTIGPVGGPGRVFAQAGDGDVIHACVDRNGRIRIVGPDEVCKARETPLDWIIVGPQGLDGLDGPPGPEGPEGQQGPPGPVGDSHWLRDGVDTFYDAGRVGIGVLPETTLDVNGVIRTTTLEIIGGVPGEQPLVAWGQVNQDQMPTTGTFTAIATGGSIGSGGRMAIRGDGTLVSWGPDEHGQVSQSPAGLFTAVAAGTKHMLAIRGDGTLASWGSDEFGLVDQTPTGLFTAIAAGVEHSLAIRSDGTMASWGKDISGQVSQTPTGTFTAVAAGGQYSLAIRGDGTLVSWGFDGEGQVSQTPTTGLYIAVAAGSAHSLAIRSDGTLVSWGSDNFGQVAQTPTGTFTAIAGGGAHSVAIRNDGTLVSWGRNVLGVLTQTPTGLFTAVAAGGGHSLAIRSDPIPGSPGLQLATDSAVKPGTNTWTILSDRRLKKNIRPLSGALDRLLRLRGVTFEWLDPARAGGRRGRDIGLIADDVQDVFPQWVGRDRKGYLTLTVGGFEALTAESLRELRAENTELTARLKKLEALVATLAGQHNGTDK